jgi:hypothetical protein
MEFVVIAVSFGLAGGVVGKIKGSSFLLWFVISAIPPFIGLLAAVFYRNEYDDLRQGRPAPRRAVHPLRKRAGIPRYTGSCAGRAGRALVPRQTSVARSWRALAAPGFVLGRGCATGTAPSLRPCQKRRSRRHERGDRCLTRH